MSNNDELLQAMMAVWVKHPGGMTQAMAAILDFLHANGYRRCAEGQRTTQWCERAEKAEAEVERLRSAANFAANAADGFRAERDVWRGRTICADDERDRLRDEVERLRANIEQWKEVVKDAFYDGFWAPATYNDTVLNEVDEEWEEYKQSPIYKAAIDAARGGEG